MKFSDRRPARHSRSKYKGVTSGNGQRWRAEIFLNERDHIHLGTFDTQEEAARAYDAAALQHRGPLAFQNFRDLQSKTEPILEGDRARVPLCSGQHFVIDAEDLPKVKKYYWRFGHGSIAGKCGREEVALHILLLGKPSPYDSIVHLNGDPLDCRKSNLGIVPRTLSAGRQRKPNHPACTSIFKGVRKASRSSWYARFRRVHLGTFDSEVDAALAHDRAARAHYGILAAVNLPNAGEISCLAVNPDKLAA